MASISKAATYKLIGAVACVPIILVLICTLIPNAVKKLGILSTSKIGDIELPKAVIADACTNDESKCISNVLLITGEIDQGTIEAIQRIDNSNWSKTVCFSSPGGSVDSAIALGTWIGEDKIATCLAERYKIKGMGTIVNTSCNSACPLIFVMGTQRTNIGNKIKVGIHRSGYTIDFCFWAFDFNGDGDSTDRYRDMYKAFQHKEMTKHLALLSDSYQVCYSNMKALTPKDWVKYSLFSQNHNDL